MSRELPILMSQPMIQAIQADRKTMIRRVIDAGRSTVCGYNVTRESNMWKGLVWDERVFVDRGPHILHPSTSQYLHVPYVDPVEGDDGRIYRVRSRIEVGDVLWVKETYVDLGNDTILYKADWTAQELADNGGVVSWKSGRFMFKKYARLWLEVTAVKAEIAKLISPEDAKAEGFQSVDEFLAYFQSLGGDAEDWVWAYTFKRIER